MILHLNNFSRSYTREGSGFQTFAGLFLFCRKMFCIFLQYKSSSGRSSLWRRENILLKQFAAGGESFCIMRRLPTPCKIIKNKQNCNEKLKLLHQEHLFWKRSCVIIFLLIYREKKKRKRKRVNRVGCICCPCL